MAPSITSGAPADLPEDSVLPGGRALSSPRIDPVRRGLVVRQVAPARDVNTVEFRLAPAAVAQAGRSSGQVLREVQGAVSGDERRIAFPARAEVEAEDPQQP